MALYIHTTVPREAEARGTVVFVHGFPFDGTMWEPQLEGLPPGWRGLAPDLPGFGRSALHASAGEVSGVLTMDRLADDLAGLIEREAAAPAVVCGLSMGGYATFSLWRRRPDLIRALILADTRAEADTDEGRENRMRMAQTARDRGTEPIAEAMLPNLLARRTFDRRPEVADRVRAMITGTAPETVVAALAGMAARRDSSADLAGIGVPTLVVVGEHDALTPPDVAREMVQRLPHATLEVIPGAGHVSNLENPGAFNRVLAGFLERL